MQQINFMKLTRTVLATLASLMLLLYCNKDSLWDTNVPETENDPTASEIEGFIFRPALVDATDERVAALKLPEGFSISKFAETNVHPRILVVSAAGHLYYSDREAGTVSMLKDDNNDGRAESPVIVATLKGAHGLAIHQGIMYIATVTEIYKATVNGDGTVSAPSLIYEKLPDGGQHPNRTLKVGPDGMLYVSIGSSCNSCAETNPLHATMVRMDLGGKNATIFASGLRNTIGFDWHPQSGELWGMDHGIDWLGDNEQKEELNLLKQGGFYGWPYIYGEGKYNGGTRPPADSTYQQYLAKTTLPAQLYDAHAAPMQMIFYSSDKFGPNYQNDAFIAMRGSWNRSKPSGYKIVRIDFENGQPVKLEEFAGNFLADNNRSQFGRVVGMAAGKNGELFFSDDNNGIIYRVVRN
jgi:glucose/arabinose dehydrogenase